MSIMSPLVIRQGDVGLDLVDSIPATALKGPAEVVRGQHPHVVVGGDVLYDGNDIYIRGGESAQMVHAEHAAVDLAGNYIVHRQVEWTNGEAVQVED